MSIGGYKFEGRYCSKSGQTDQEWALLMHKTKVAAFMAANARADAGWAYHMDGSPDGVYHCLDSVGNNYCTCFYNESAGTYLGLYTLTYFTGSGTDSGSVKVALDYGILVSSSTYYVGYNAGQFVRVGITEIKYDDALDYVHLGVSRIIPVGNTGASTSNIGSGYSDKTNTNFRYSAPCFGFAIKGDNVIAFIGSHGGSSTLACSAISGNAFSSFARTGDIGRAFIWNFQLINTSTSSNDEDASRSAGTSSLISSCALALDIEGKWFDLPIRIAAVPMAQYYGSVEKYPFQSLMAYKASDSVGHIYGKGVIKIDLVSMQWVTQSGLLPSLYRTFANGNYLCVRGATSSEISFSSLNVNATSSDNSYYVALYCGWDPSNPDITQSSAWTEYTES